jgi:hypothetical protein
MQGLGTSLKPYKTSVIELQGHDLMVDCLLKAEYLFKK